MKTSSAVVLAVATMALLGLSCALHPAYPEFANQKEPGIWEDLEDANCDIDSDEAHAYVDCLWNVYEEYDNDYSLHTDECDVELAKVPGCDMGILGSAASRLIMELPSSGTAVYVCDVSAEEEGTYNDEYCPLDHSVELKITIDWSKRHFTYYYRSLCQRATYDFVYDYVRTETQTTEGGGDVTERGWLLGRYTITSTRHWECGPPRYCGQTGQSPSDEVQTSDVYIVGKLETLTHLEMGLQNQQYPMDLETLAGFNSWADMESAWRGSKVYDCHATTEGD
jgi:hypothetical protein